VSDITQVVVYDLVGIGLAKAWDRRCFSGLCRRGDGKVTIGDSDFTLFRSLEALLTSDGPRVYPHGSPGEACSLIERGEALDALIIDDATPELGLRRTKRHRLEDCEVILVSGQTGLVKFPDLEAMAGRIFLGGYLDSGECRMLSVLPSPMVSAQPDK
jgi:hypothetical protein